LPGGRSVSLLHTEYRQLIQYYNIESTACIPYGAAKRCDRRAKPGYMRKAWHH